MRVIYQIRNRVNNKVYIGKTTKPLHNRWQLHVRMALKGSNFSLRNAIRKYGPENFDVWILYSDAVTAGHLNMLEEMFIKQFKSNNPKYGYNMTSGGDGGAMSLEVRKRMSASLKGEKNPRWGKKWPKEVRLKISESQKGKTLSKETRKKISNALTGNKNSWGCPNFLGHSHSVETRNKLSRIQKRLWSQREAA